MRNSFFKKSLAVLLSIMILLTAFGGALSVFAEDTAVEEVVTDPYGTATTGFETALNKLHHIDAVEGVLDLTGANGLKYWSSKHDRAGFASDYAVAVEDDDHGYAIGIINSVDGAIYDGIETVDFTIPGAKVGDNYYLTYEFKVNPKLGDYIAEYNAANPDTPISTTDLTNICGNVRPYHILFTEHTHSAEVKDHNVDGANTTLDNLVSKSGVWGYSVTSALTVASETPTFSVLIQSFIPTSKEETTAEDGTVTAAVEWREKLAEILGDEPLMYFANLRVCTYDGSNYVDARTNETLVLGQPVGGTAQSGIRVTLISGAFIFVKDQGSTNRADKYTPYPTTFNNGDFSDGFKYWTIRFNHKETYVDHVRTTSLNDIFTLEDGAAKFTGAPATDIDSYYGLVSAPMQLDLEAGEQIVVTAKTKGSTAISFWLTEIGGSTQTGNDRATGATGTSWASKSSAAFTVKNDNPTLIIESQIASNSTTNGAGAMVDNFKILKVNADGTYTDIVTNEICNVTGEPVLGGTTEGGYTTSNNVSSSHGTQYYDAPQNFDFDEGFKYWTAKSDKSGSADSQMALYTVDGKTYAGIKSGSDKWAGILSAPFKGTGETVTLFIESIVNAKLKDKSFDTAYADETYKYPCNVIIKKWAVGETTTTDVANNSFVSRVADGEATVNVLTFATDANYYYSIQLQQCITASAVTANCGGEPPVLYRFRAVTETASGIWTDLSDSKTYYRTNREVGGTAEEGVGYGYDYTTKLYPGVNNSPNGTAYFGSTEGLANGDFSDGFKYWALKGDAYGKASDDGTVTVSKLSDVFSLADGVVTFKGLAKEADAYLGFQSTPFTLKDVTAKNETIYFAMDFIANKNQRFKVYTANGTVTKDNITASDWITVYTDAITVSDNTATYAIEIQSYKNDATAQYKNFRVVKDDKGGLENAPKVTLEGAIDNANDLYGDANYDGKVDLVDLVRMKKYMINQEGDVAIFFAASDIAVNDVIDATDLGYVIDHIIGKTEITGRVEA